MRGADSEYHRRLILPFDDWYEDRRITGWTFPARIRPEIRIEDMITRFPVYLAGLDIVEAIPNVAQEVRTWLHYGRLSVIHTLNISHSKV